MCGIAGLWAPNHPDPRNRVAAMVRTLHHRGPDSQGQWSAPDAGPCFGHARLSVVDLSAQGHQPMLSASGRYAITFNGEIYNHQALRHDLGVHPWRGHSDTESLLAAIERWGVRAALQRAVGMFAFGLWDHELKTLTLARDRLGEKPLYYAHGERGFAFASELKALRSVEGVDLSLDPHALGLYLQLGQVPAPLSIHRGIRKLAPGTLMALQHAGGEPELEPYWRLPSAPAQTDASSDAEAIEQLEALLQQSVRGQLMSDVPLGVFLSGGVDSSLIAALMQRASSRPVRSFSIGFDEAEFDESPQARAVARHLGTEHTELRVTAADAIALVPLLPRIYDEPFADSSQIPTLLLSQLTRGHVTVALSGDGGDELFGGYNRHIAAARFWPAAARVPAVLRRQLAQGLAVVPASWWDAAGAGLRLTGAAPSSLGEKLQKLAALLGARDVTDAYLSTLLHWAEPGALLGRAAARPVLAPAYGATLAEHMMAWDLQGYLPDDILVKVDRAAMAHSLETRVPLLDHRIVEFALRTPLHRKIRDGQSKWLLRQVLYRHVPRTLIERPKQGFSIPLDRWLRGPLRDWAESLLTPTALEDAGWLQPAPIRTVWRQHLGGQRNHQQRLWTVLMFQAWVQQQNE